MEELYEVAEDFVSTFVPTRFQPTYLVLRQEKWNVHQLLLNFDRDLATKKNAQLRLLAKVTRLVEEKKDLAQYPDPIGRTLLLSQKNQDLKSVAKELCSIRLRIRSVEKSKELASNFQDLLEKATADSALTDSIRNFNLALGTNQIEYQKKLEQLTEQFADNVEHQTTFRETFQETVGNSLKDKEVVDELHAMSRIVGIPLTQNVEPEIDTSYPEPLATRS